MTAHTHTAITPGCYRCELNLDEMEAIASECFVSGSGVVHYDDCSHLADAHNMVRWTAAERLATDRPCTRCMLSGLPVAVPA